MVLDPTANRAVPPATNQKGQAAHDFRIGHVAEIGDLDTPQLLVESSRIRHDLARAFQTDLEVVPPLDGRLRRRAQHDTRAVIVHKLLENPQAWLKVVDR